jgi:hypothetical protein
MPDTMRAIRLTGPVDVDGLTVKEGVRLLTPSAFVSLYLVPYPLARVVLLGVPAVLASGIAGLRAHARRTRFEDVDVGSDTPAAVKDSSGDLHSTR